RASSAASCLSCKGRRAIRAPAPRSLYKTYRPRVPLGVSLGPNSDKANLGIVALHGQANAGDCRGLVIETRLAEIVGVEPKQQTMPAVRCEMEDLAGRPIDGHQRRDRGNRRFAGQVDAAAIVRLRR